MALTKIKLIADGTIVQSHLHASHGITTADIGEGSNLYYTDARARAAISVSGNALSYNSSTGVITSNFEESPTFTGDITMSKSTSGGLYIKTTSNVEPFIALFRNNASNGIGVLRGIDGGHLYIDTGATGAAQSTKMVIEAGGNVGIGTTSPSYKLEVNGGTALVGGGFYVSSDQSIITSSTYTFRDGVYINNPNSTSAAVSSNSVMSIGAMTGNSVSTSLITTGAIGIGTTSPSAKLHLYVNSANDDTFHIFNGSVRTHLLASESSNGVIYMRSSANSNTVRINASGFSYFNGGNVGIGTTSPSQKLSIRDDSTSAYPLTLENINIGTVGAHTGIRFGYINNTYQKGAIIFEGQDANGRGKMYFAMEGTANSSNADETDAKMTIDYSGNVGIGITDPDEALEIGAAGKLKLSRADNARSMFLYTDNSSGTIETDVDPIFLKSANRIGFSCNGSERMRITTSGNVGIGTTSPDFALDIEAESSGVQLQIGRTVTSAGSTWMGSDSNGFHLGVGAYGAGNSVSDPNGFTVDTSGNIGIGTTSPLAKLHIDGTGDLIRAVSTNAGAGGAQMDLLHHTSSPANNDVHGVINFGGYYSGTNQSYGTSIKSVWTDVGNQHGQLQFFTRDGSYHSERAKIDMHGHAAKVKFQSNSSADVVNTTFAEDFHTFQGHGKKFIGQFVIRDGSEYLDVALNSTANNVMYYIYVIGYLYNRGTYVGITSGYTYTNNSIINHNSGDILDLGVGKSIVSYRGTNSTAGDYTGYLCFRFTSGSSGYSEGQLQVYVSSHSLSWQKFVDVHAVVQNDTTNNYFAQ